MIAIIFIVAWIAYGVVSGLAFYCYLQREYPLLAVTSRAADIRDAFFIIPYGFISLVVMITKGCFKHGINPFRK